MWPHRMILLGSKAACPSMGFTPFWNDFGRLKPQLWLTHETYKNYSKYKKLKHVRQGGGTQRPPNLTSATPPNGFWQVVDGFHTSRAPFENGVFAPTFTNPYCLLNL